MAASRRLATFGAKKLQAANAPGNWLPSMALSILRKTGSSFAKTHLKSSSPKTLLNNNRPSTKRNKAGIVLHHARFVVRKIPGYQAKTLGTNLEKKFWLSA